MPASVLTTDQLILRPLTGADVRLPKVIQWHLDPEGYRDMHEEPYADANAFLAVGAEWVEAWADGGPSYWLAVDRASGEPVGVGGIRRLVFRGRAYANLYYRLDPAARGRGLGREIATAAVAYGQEWWPDLATTARVAAANEPSRRVARAAGLREIGPWRAPDDVEDQPAPILFTSPVAVVGPPADEVAYEDLVSLWSAVNAAGGAVGFVGAAPRPAVAAALEQHLAQVDRGETMLVQIFEPTEQSWDDPARHGALLGFGLVHRYGGPAAHRANLERVMVDPTQQGRGLGRVLMSTLHAVARQSGVELATIGYRGRTGLGHFYGRAGYVETGRLPGGLRIADDAGSRDVDDVQMAYRLNGKNLGARA